MRDNNEVMDQIIGFAEKDNRVLAVYMNGSRVNINAVKDDYQDYDVVYVVRETESFIEDENWISFLGEISYMQLPDNFDINAKETYDSYAYLMQFMDGVRIDLTLKTKERALREIREDSLTKVILDKEKILPEVKMDDTDYWVKLPTEKEFSNTCNEFWWCTNNIAKGLWRREIPYFQDIINFINRKELEKNAFMESRNTDRLQCKHRKIRKIYGQVDKGRLRKVSYDIYRSGY